MTQHLTCFLYRQHAHLNDGLHVFGDKLLLQHPHDGLLRRLVQVVGRPLCFLVDPGLHLLDVHGRTVLRQELLALRLQHMVGSGKVCL